MTSYSIADLVEAVKVVLDRNRDSSALISDEDLDTLMQDDVIKDSILKGAELIEAEAPVNKIGYGSKLTDYIALSPESVQSVKLKPLTEASYMTRILLPDRLMRLISVKMSDWERPGKIITEDDEEYLWQSSRWSGVRGCPQKPVAALVTSEEGLCLELYSSRTSDAKLTQGVYLEYPQIASGIIKLPEKLKEAIVYMSAYLVSLTMGDTQTAAGLVSTAYKLAGIENKQAQEQQTNEDS